MSQLISGQNRVQSPFIILQIGKYTFGSCEKGSIGSRFNTKLNITYPNFMKSMQITKVNGAINTYVINLVYGISQFDDPNLLEKVFGTISGTREIKISYGDWNTPNYIYQEEDAIITNVKTSVNMQNGQISYTLSCTSTSVKLKAGQKNYPACFEKPSDVIKGLIYDETTGIQDVFGGMRKKEIVNKLIVSDDQKVEIPAALQKNVFDYIGFLVNNMISISDKKDSIIKTSRYYWSVYDDVSNEYGGSYFKVQKTDARTLNVPGYNTYEVDIGYPGGSEVTQFSFTNDQSWSILYDYAQEANMPKYVYNMDNFGGIQTSFSPSITNNNLMFQTTELDRTWWSNVTQFPISATLTIKGLLRPAMLLSYVKVNTFFYGNKHISSGLYIITKQVDNISGNGYSTTLSLTRIQGDAFENYDDNGRYIGQQFKINPKFSVNM